MRHVTSIVVLATLALSVLAGCAAPPGRDLSTERAQYAFLPNGRDPVHPERLPPPIVPSHDFKVSENFEEGVIAYYERVRGHALNILQLSGGGQNGAFGAGFLVGWAETGTRPQFDLVTGVSAGALLATHALLGTPEDDKVLGEIFTTISTDDVYRSRGLVQVAFGANSLLDTSPLAALIAKYITAETLERVAAAYDEDRRLWVGTTNLDYDQTWVWNMSLLAKDNRPGALERYRKILLASASPAIAFPPVEIDGHLFADGATRQNMVVLGLAGAEEPPPPRHGPGNMFLIYNGRLNVAPTAIDNSFADIAGTSIGITMSSTMQATLLRSYFSARVHGYTYNLAEIPADADVGRNPLAFDPQQMRAGFDAGRALAKQPDPWEHVPPNHGDFPPWALKYLGER